MTNMPDDAIDSIVYVIDDDSAMRQAVETLLDSVDLTVKLFASPTEFLAMDLPEVPSCVVLDVRLKGQNGLQVQEQIARQLGLPVILMTAHGDIPMSVRAMKTGAVDFLPKPFRGQDMVEAVTAALEVDRERRAKEQTAVALRKQYESLTPRERKIMELVAAGLLNKQIATELNLSEITVKLHRGQAMKKMKSASFADFVLKAEALGLVKGPAGSAARD
ncbi:response regulator transcription factor [Paraburkholderia sp. BR14320]|uniref:response regulator transcription factor n=1 Tax=unclassified Paraburkholderia TaxID=2615204 RepID=UPI0034CDD0EB